MEERKRVPDIRVVLDVSIPQQIKQHSSHLLYPIGEIIDKYIQEAALFLLTFPPRFAVNISKPLSLAIQSQYLSQLLHLW